MDKASAPESTRASLHTATQREMTMQIVLSFAPTSKHVCALQRDGRILMAEVMIGMMTKEYESVEEGPAPARGGAFQVCTW